MKVCCCYHYYHYYYHHFFLVMINTWFYITNSYSHTEKFYDFSSDIAFDNVLSTFAHSYATFYPITSPLSHPTPVSLLYRPLKNQWKSLKRTTNVQSPRYILTNKTLFHSMNKSEIVITTMIMIMMIMMY